MPNKLFLSLPISALMLATSCGESLQVPGSQLSITIATRGFGIATATGDFNKDGIPDIAVGHPDHRPSGSGGRVYVYTRDGEAIIASATLRQGNLDREEENDEFGHSLAVGDFNHDGYSDLAVGAPGNQGSNNVMTGRVFIFKGSASGLRPAFALTQAGLDTDEAGDNFGSSLTAGDFNGDGLDDLAVGAEWKAIGNSTNESGAVFLFQGHSTDLLKPDRVLDQTGLGANEDWDVFGYSLVALDFNKDGIQDLAVGALYEAPGSEPGSGVVFVYKGSRQGLKPEQVLDQEGLGKNEHQDWFGASLAAGDINGDGYEDLAVGANQEDEGAGAVFTFKGSSTNLKPWQLIQQNGLGSNEASDDFGQSLTLADFNGDGKADLAVGAPNEAVSSGPRSGAVFIYRGGANGVTASKVFTSSAITPPSTSAYFGFSVLGSDLNQDGKADLIIGSPGLNAAYIYKGQTGDLAGWTFVRK